MNYPPPYAPPLPPKKKSGWVNVLLIGCGCLMGLGLATIAIMALIGYSIFNQEDPNDTAIMLDNLNLKGKPAVMYGSAEEITGKIAEMLRPEGMETKVQLVFQSIEGLHSACPDHLGDWYFTGDYPTPGGLRKVNQAFVEYFENNTSEERTDK